MEPNDSIPACKGVVSIGERITALLLSGHVFPYIRLLESRRDARLLDEYSLDREDNPMIEAWVRRNSLVREDELQSGLYVLQSFCFDTDINLLEIWTECIEWLRFLERTSIPSSNLRLGYTAA